MLVLNTHFGYKDQNGGTSGKSGGFIAEPSGIWRIPGLNENYHDGYMAAANWHDCPPHPSQSAKLSLSPENSLNFLEVYTHPWLDALGRELHVTFC